jgi:hypothetical protein
VGTNEDEHQANGVNGTSNGTAHANGHAATNGVSDGTNGTVNGSVNGVNGHTNGHTNGTADGHAANGTNGVHKPYPYNTPAEPGNPTVMPREIQERFHFAFLIRDPHFSVPSYYRCTIPPLDEVTGFYNYDPSEAGYDELRRHFDYLRHEGLVGPRVATRPDLHLEDESKTKETVHEICVVDADDMLDNPAPMIEAFCRSVGLPYSPDILNWDTPEDYDFACFCFEKWRGFHNDAIESSGLVARDHVSIYLEKMGRWEYEPLANSISQKKPVKTEEEYDAEWTKKYGPKGAALIRQAVDANMADYLYLKQFSMKV